MKKLLNKILLLALIAPSIALGAATDDLIGLGVHPDLARKIDSLYVNATGAETIAGNKTFSNNVSVGGTLGVTGVQTNAADSVFTATSHSLRADTADASDTKQIRITGGGAVGSSRGAYLSLSGNEGPNSGAAALVSAAIAGANLDLISSTTNPIRAYTNSLLRWQIAGGSGDFTQDATNGGNIVLSKAGTGVVDTLTASLAAAGTTISDAAQITNTYTSVDSASGTNGAKLMQSMTVGQSVRVFNNNASNALLVYPPTSGDTISGYSAGGSFSLAARATAVCIKVTATVYQCTESPLA